ncbi:TetR/AcrR family transcriptional regulator [Kibdelosporangium persicum]|uniref:DNA-binding transcriptional repressor AcrR n=1 Tax=Kibdelosporangium persicum TaxID=2698649 RepID=A0ABX2F2J0_9PSEU|nr:TetR/AcrR family transcriptional regulator [Kibdelosporangium persicum]NRN65556.1 DNA-binding transcriptional repressor AcrR [Kibdelosporangium persicum]
MEDVATPRRGRPPASEAHRQRQRLDISRHAVRLFAAQGVAATSGEQIARAAGVSERTLWRYFPTKESCVEPLLTKMIDAFQAVLRGWPRELDLTEHLRAAYTPVLDSSSGTDIEAVLAVVRMTHDEPALRAVYLMLRERSEETFAEVLADRMAMPPDAFEVRVQAAAMNAVLKVASDHLAAATANERLTSKTLDRHRQHIADAVSLVIRGLSDKAGS